MSNNPDTDVKYVIVQAGGKGSRMKRLTRNKPKALVPVNNLPMIFHLFRKFPDKQFVVIADYKFDVMEKYLAAFAQVDYSIVNAGGHSGTCAGISEALGRIPERERFMLIWSDLVLPEDYELPMSDRNVIGISKDFQCRWKYEDNRLSEEPSSEFGVAGLFVFQDKRILAEVPKDGEFVRWLQSKEIMFEQQPLFKTHEYGLLSEWEKLPKQRTRPFNRIEIDGDKLSKIPVDDQGRELAVREESWYQHLADEHFRNIPEIYSYAPLTMEYVDGRNIYEYEDISDCEKDRILSQVIGCLKDVHRLESFPCDIDSYRVAYLDKTYDRLKKVRYLVPFADDETVIVNGRECRNIFYCQEQVNDIVMRYVPDSFCLIHGDCTFSNMMLKSDRSPVLIDPRGYFGNTLLYGDPAYDWVKLYYSLVGDYDQFNLKRFDLFINDGESDHVYSGEMGEVSLAPRSVALRIRSNRWDSMEDAFFEKLQGEVTVQQMKIFHAITWLSLTTYAWEDYDSICGAFYNGLYYLEDALAYFDGDENEGAVHYE